MEGGSISLTTTGIVLGDVVVDLDTFGSSVETWRGCGDFKELAICESKIGVLDDLKMGSLVNWRDSSSLFGGRRSCSIILRGCSFFIFISGDLNLVCESKDLKL